MVYSITKFFENQVKQIKKDKKMNNFLQDLYLAGVKWELDETAFGIARQDAESGALATTKAPRVATTAIVPPISPIVQIAPETARAMAARPTTIEALLRMIMEFNHPLRAGVTNVVLPHIASNPNKLMIITDIPSSEDDASGNILSGPAGELLDKMLTAIGMSRENVHITPLLFWRTPGGRSPTETEIALSRPFVDRIIELTEPRIILTFGTLSAANIANLDLMHHHGEMATLVPDIKVFPVYHPNYLILKPSAKQAVWTVLQNIQNMLKSV